MYNVERFLPECVESIRTQTLEDIEIILVDDGSPDRCGEIAEEYAREDERIRVVHRENGGLGPARNSGLEVARGEYVGFVDSDDWVEPNMYENLYGVLRRTGAQIAFTGMKVVRHGKTIQTREHPFAGETLQGSADIFRLRRAFYGAAAERVSDDPTPVSVWLAGYNRGFLERFSLRFRNVRSEDKFFNTEACRAAESVTCIAGTPYCYRKDDQPSITKTFKRDTMDSFFRLFRLLEQLADEEPDAYWDEVHERTDRCIIDYSRVLICMIEKSSENKNKKEDYVRETCGNPALRRACKGFPLWKLPFKQAAFCLGLKLQTVQLLRIMASTKETIMPYRRG